MTPILWSSALPSDADALAALGSATFLTSFAFDHPGEALISYLQDQHSIAFYRDALANPEVHILIGKTPLGAPVGYAMLTPTGHPQHSRVDDIELKRIYLLGPWQGGGNGQDLMKRIISQARELSAKRILLAVYENNVRAQAFYQRIGFNRIGDCIFMVGNVPFNDLIFCMDL
jgi:diamine N-acetyltransferase